MAAGDEFRQAGSFVPTTNIWDPAEIQEVDVNSPKFKELLVRMYQNLSNISTLLNIKDTGIYSLQEHVCGQIYFPAPLLDSSSAVTPVPRQVYRKVINFGALPNDSSKLVSTGLTPSASWLPTRIYGATTNGLPSSVHSSNPKWLMLPYAASHITIGPPTYVTFAIELRVEGTEVIITTKTDYSSFTKTFVVLEYIKTE